MALPAYVRKGKKFLATLDVAKLLLSGTDVSLGLTSASVSGATSTVATGITASATQTLAGATKLVARVNVVATSATSGDAVALPAMQPGQSVTVFNDGANPISVFPAAGTIAIDGSSAGAAVTLTNAKRATFYCLSATVIKSAQLGVASA